MYQHLCHFLFYFTSEMLTNSYSYFREANWMQHQCHLETVTQQPSLKCQ